MLFFFSRSLRQVRCDKGTADIISWMAGAKPFNSELEPPLLQVCPLWHSTCAERETGDWILETLLTPKMISGIHDD